MDVDIDFDTKFDPLTVFPQAVRASQLNNGKLSKHSAGAYLQAIPKDDVTGLAAIPYDRAEEFGYFKIDFLHINPIDDFAKYLSKAELRKMASLDPNWNLLNDRTVVERLFQIHSQFNLVKQVKPTNVMMLADVIALIRPHGRRLLPEYLKCTNEKEREVIRSVLYTSPEDGLYYYKRPHSVGYSATIVIQLHLIEAGLL